MPFDTMTAELQVYLEVMYIKFTSDRVSKPSNVENLLFTVYYMK